MSEKEFSQSECSYIFVDESGKPEIYSAKGLNLVEQGQATKYLVLAAVKTSDQLELQRKVTDFRAELLHDQNLTKIFSSAYSLDSFHAHNDYPEVKERFYQFIKTIWLEVDVMVVDKLKCSPVLQENPGKLYGVMAGHLLKNICHQTEKTEIIFSRKDSKLKLRKELEVEVERVRLEFLDKHPKINAQLILSYQHNPHYSHGGLQVADYVAHAVFQKYENGNDQWFDLIKKKISYINDICNQKHYTKKDFT